MRICQDCALFSIWLCSVDAVFCSIPAGILYTRCWSNITSKLTSEGGFQLTGFAALAAKGAALAVAVMAGIALLPCEAAAIANKNGIQLTGLAALAAKGADAAAAVLAGITLQPLCALVVFNVLECLPPSLQQHKSIFTQASDVCFTIRIVVLAVQRCSQLRAAANSSKLVAFVVVYRDHWHAISRPRSQPFLLSTACVASQSTSLETLGGDSSNNCLGASVSNRLA